MHGTLRLFPVFISPIVWKMCENLYYESVYFKELHNEQEYYMTDNIQSGGSCSITYQKRAREKKKEIRVENQGYLPASANKANSFIFCGMCLFRSSFTILEV